MGGFRVLRKAFALWSTTLRDRGERLAGGEEEPAWVELDNQSRRHTRKGEPEAPKRFIPSKAEVSFAQRSLGRGHARVIDSSPQRTASPPPTEGVCSDPKRSSGVGEVGAGASLPSHGESKIRCLVFPAHRRVGWR